MVCILAIAHFSRNALSRERVYTGESSSRCRFIAQMRNA
jgi:hypothetical protein